MTTEEKIAGAAEIITSEINKRGGTISLPEATVLAKQLHQFWSERVQITSLKAGEVAQRLRERIVYTVDDVKRMFDEPKWRDRE